VLWNLIWILLLNRTEPGKKYSIWKLIWPFFNNCNRVKKFSQKVKISFVIEKKLLNYFINVPENLIAPLFCIIFLHFKNIAVSLAGMHKTYQLMKMMRRVTFWFVFLLLLRFILFPYNSLCNVKEHSFITTKYKERNRTNMEILKLKTILLKELLQSTVIVTKIWPVPDPDIKISGSEI